MAKRFQFRLEPLLKLRSHKVEQAKEALHFVMAMRIAKDEMIEMQKDYLKELTAKKMESSSVAEIQAHWHHKVYIEEDIKKLIVERNQILEIESLKRDDLALVMKDEKIILKLKDKKLIAHKKEVLKEETQAFDETAQIQYIRALKSVNA
ncbi:MAG: hypothetical protein HW421_1900 [Ignavibacteria bacterium]|nr:hypothetical protein [Ignavibacteria bacterium]